MSLPAEVLIPDGPEWSAAKAGGCVENIPSLPDEEWNQTARDYPRDKFVHQLFEEQVARTPEAVAVVFEDRSLTYRELNARANQLAHHLRSLGVGPEVLVGLCLERSLEMVVGLLGILKAGGAYVPFDPSYPKARLTSMLENSGCAWFVTENALESRFFDGLAEAIFLDDLPQGLADENLTGSVSHRNLAYILHTSGSTGQPKGVAMEHGPLVNLLWWGSNQSNEGLSTLQFASVNFDVSFQEMFSTWLSGGTLVLINRHLRLQPAALWEFIAAQKLQRLFLPVIMLKHLVEASVSSRVPAPALREIITAGEPLRITPDIRGFFAAQPTLTLHNHYGPTESHVVTSYTMPASAAGWPELPPIGKPIFNAAIHLLDKHLKLVPIGLPGEIHIGGEALARGYYNHPDLTAERFIRDPFSQDPGARLYKTGDLARYLPDGNIEYLGRLDHQVKIRGFRIELGEIEAAISGHPDISACMVVTRNDERGDKTLTAFVVGGETGGLSAGTLRQWLGEKLPDYMIPSRFFVLPALPLTPNGKVDRKALEKMDGVELDSGTDYVAPRTELESKLVAIWQAVLRRERVGIHDNFFELGGHSLLAVLVGSQITRQLDVEVPLRWIFEHPTIAGLARQLELQKGLSSGNQPIGKADRGQPLPVSFAQQGMWLLHQTLPDAATYNQPVAFRLSGRVDGERVRKSLRRMMERHEILRTALVRQGEALVQQIAAEVQLPWVEVDLQGVPADQKESVLEERMVEEARRPFELAQAPLWRALWITLAGDEQVLAFTFHHSMVDEWTLRLFFQELEQLYATDGSVELAGLTEVPVQYADFAVWQRLRLTGDLLEQQRVYWREQLRDLPPALELPADKARPPQPSGRGAVHDFQLTGPVVTRLRELAREEGTTLFTVMLAAFHVWLHRYTGQADMVVATPITQRERPEVQSLLGLFLNTLPIRLRSEGNPNFREVLRQVRDALLGAFRHADLPFEQMVQAALRDRTSGHHPLSQVMFVLLEEGLPAMRLGPIEARPLPLETRTSKCDLTLSIKTADDTWDCKFEYATDLFNARTVASMGRNLTELVRSITEETEESICRLNLMPTAERHQVLVEWNQTARDYPRDKCIHELFENQAREKPDAVALELGGKRMTYGELSQASDHIAQHLWLRGVKAGAVVGLSVERSFERVVALLGILKAGAVYWALEENLPEARLQWLIGNAQPALILCGRNTAGDFSGMASVCGVENLLAAPLDEPTREPRCTSPEDPAYISYTSGSTGRPKGVVVPHRGVVRLVKGTDYVSLTSQETLLHLSPLSFDASTFELWGALLNGGRVVLMPPGQPSLAEIGSVIRHHGITTLWLTAGLFHLMVDERPDDLKPLRQLLAGGDVLSPMHVAKARRALPACTIINGYGPTENTTFTCCYTVTADIESLTTVPIGRPIANTRVYILDANLQPVPVGVAGELYAGGDGVACGYLNQPELTEERFIPDPFSLKSGERLYRTGDRVRWRDDGNIEFLGRMDHQVKIRGFRVEMGEIESALRAIPGVREAVVVQREGMGTERPLVAYLVGTEKAPLDPDAIRQPLRNRLPEYMIPSAFVTLDQFPLMPNGKLDRRNLTAHEPTGEKAAAESGQAKDLLELRLIRIWERLFQRTGIGRDDNFFDLGGHSLQATRLVAAIERQLGQKHSIASLFQTPTVALFASRLIDNNLAPAGSSLVPLQASGSKPPIFFIHGIGGDVYVYLELAKLLGDDQPSYGVQSLSGRGKSEIDFGLSEMAADYAREIISFYPSGPYRLLGYSLGGIIAYEVAQELRKSGHEVDLLALLDTEPHKVETWEFYCMFVPERCLYHISEWAKKPMSDKLDYVRKRWNAFRHRLDWNLRRQAAASGPEPVREPASAAQSGFLEAPFAVTSAHVMKRYPGRLDFFKAEDGNTRWRWYWSYLARSGVVTHRIKGNHGQILKKDNVSSLAKALASRLEHEGIPEFDNS